ncbi:chromate transporter [Corynebacterium sp. ZY180755]
MSGKTYADLVALCQFLPWPASSQVGMAVGLQCAGYLGMFAVWFAFTMPSVIALVLFALGVAVMGDISDAGLLAGLKTAAVAVVAHAVLGMTQSLITDKIRAGLAGLRATPDADDDVGFSSRVPKSVAFASFLGASAQGVHWAIGAVVGILAAALYDSVFIAGVTPRPRWLWLRHRLPRCRRGNCRRGRS